jgi:hypothetical protein
MHLLLHDRTSRYKIWILVSLFVSSDEEDDWSSF